MCKCRERWMRRIGGRSYILISAAVSSRTMGRKSKVEQREAAERRRQLGGYSDAEFDSALARSQSSDAFSVGVRLITLAAVFWLMARAIQIHGIPAWLLALPMLVEFIVIFWVGYFMSRFLIDCRAFAQSAGGLRLTLIWTVIILMGVLAAAAFDPESDGLRFAHIAAGLAWGWQQIRSAGLHWVILVSILGLLISTTFEVLRWRRLHGVFVWTSIMHTGFRLGVMFVLGFFAAIALIPLGDFLASFVSDRMQSAGTAMAWAVFGFLLLSELLTVIISALMHREALKKQGPRTVTTA
jgi:hypothetical protein